MSSHHLTEVVDVPADLVFATVTDLARLPEWNDVITGVVERPTTLAPGAEWVVELRALGQQWHSRATVLEYDPTNRRFAYRSRSDDGNPSWAGWTWTVVPVTPSQCEITVLWTVNPKTFWRRVLLAHIRSFQLRREVAASIRRLASMVDVDDG